MNKTAAFVSSVMEQLISIPCDENRGLETYCPFFHHFYSLILWLFKAIDLLLKWTNTAMIRTVHGLIKKKTFWLSERWVTSKSKQRTPLKTFENNYRACQSTCEFFLFVWDPFTQIRLLAPIPKALEILGNSETKPKTTQWCTLKVSCRFRPNWSHPSEQNLKNS